MSGQAVGSCAPAINIPLKALKLHHAKPGRHWWWQGWWWWRCWWRSSSWWWSRQNSCLEDATLPTLAINIPVKALKLHHAEAARGNPRPVFNHHGRFSNMDSLRRSLPQRKQSFLTVWRRKNMKMDCCGYGIWLWQTWIYNCFGERRCCIHVIDKGRETKTS